MDQYSPTVFEPVDPAMFTRPDAGDDQLFVVFYMGVLRNEPRSVEEGRAIYDDIECCRVIVPGDRNNIVDRPATPHDKARFAKQYALFKQGVKEEDQVSGTRLSDWPFLTRAQCEELRYLGIKTVEHLATARDDVCARVPGLTSLKQKAGIWLDKSKTAAEATRLDRLISGLQNENESMKAAMAEQAKRIESLLNQQQAAKA